MTTFFTRIAHWFDRFAELTQYHPTLESYLNQAQNVSEIESRIREWERTSFRHGTYFLS